MGPPGVRPPPAPRRPRRRAPTAAGPAAGRPRPVPVLHPHDQDLYDALTLFEVGRRQWARVLRLLPNAAFDRAGVHNRRGRVTVGQLVWDYVKHVDDHLRFVHAKRERLGEPSPG